MAEIIVAWRDRTVLDDGGAVNELGFQSSVIGKPLEVAKIRNGGSDGGVERWRAMG